MKTVGMVPTVGMVGRVGSQAEETGEPEEAQRADRSPATLEARLDKAFAEPDYERQKIFEYLKEFRAQKRLNQRFERQQRAREAMRAEVESALHEDAERSRKSERTSGEAMAENAGVGISFVEDENGKLVKRRTPADNVYGEDENGDPPPRRFTQEDRERAYKNRDRYTRSSWRKRLRAIAEGHEIVTKEQLQAHLAYGRSRGWHLPPLSKR